MKLKEVAQKDEWENVESPSGYTDSEREFLVNKLHSLRLRRKMLRVKLAELGLERGNTDSPYEWLEMNGSVPGTAHIMVITQPKNSALINRLMTQFNQLQDQSNLVYKKLKRIEK